MTSKSLHTSAFPKGLLGARRLLGMFCFFLPLLLPFSVALLLVSCGQSGPSFRIKGTFRDMQAGELYIYNMSNDNPRFDTLAVANGSFVYKGQATEVTPYMLVFPNGIEQVIFVDGGQDLKYEATANDLKNYVVSGSAENELMNQFRQDTYTMPPSEVVAAARQFINANAASPVAVYMFDHYFLNNPDVSLSEAKAALAALAGAQPDSRRVKDIGRRIDAASRLGEGKQMADATLTLRDKTTAKLWATSADCNLVVFWATWLPGGYDISWRIRQLHDEFNKSEDGNAAKKAKRLRVAAVSLDIERFRWEEATRADSLPTLQHFCDGLGFESPVAKRYGIATLPLYVLTDRQHKIIASTTSADKIRTEIEKALSGK